MDYTFTDTKIENFTDFTEEIIDTLKTHYGPGAKIKTHSITKNNGVVYTGLTVNKNRKEVLSPIIYLEPYFDDYNAGRNFNDIVECIIKQREDNSIINDFDPSIIMDFDKIEHNICVKLVNAELNKELLANVPHKRIKDLAAIFYILAYTKEDGNGTITITKEMMGKWRYNIKIKELYKLALENTQRLFPGKINDMGYMINKISGFAPNVDDLEVEYAGPSFNIYKEVDAELNPLYVVTNVANVSGACVLLYDELLKTFAKKIDGNFYILPSSIHEVLFVPEKANVNKEELKDMVCSVNQEVVDTRDFLSDNVYYYDMDTDSLSVV